ncbi:hypothetical protein QMK17_26030 [Rhodococcus sp. G-MC3]|uniref:hypothetical protein n=1 Tax=Rhodococcus sp. G-MC3 TaxID=3046209 RepID=UPI0024BB71DF|nr:hypothetical protein [Rhodococcus sp. G-MC3]MDJ0396751.1 hypothetical protein [Rhodococcus sp. G-MC3]
MPGANTTATDLLDAPPEGLLPEDFDPVALVLCEFYGDRPETNTQILRETERSGVGLSAATAALAARTGVPRDPEDCDTVTSAPLPVVWAVNKQDRAVRLGLPKDGCGQLKNDPLAAVYELPAISVEEYELPIFS